MASDSASDITVTQSIGDARYVRVTGSGMTGALTLYRNPTEELHAATKQYVDRAVTTAVEPLSYTPLDVTSFNGRQGDVVPINGDYTADQVGALPITGGRMRGELILAENPVGELEATPKRYVDELFADVCDQSSAAYEKAVAAYMLADSAVEASTIAEAGIEEILTNSHDITIQDASTTVKGITMLTDSVISTSTTSAATPASVKMAYDLASSASDTATSAYYAAEEAAEKASDAASAIADMVTDTSNVVHIDGGATLIVDEAYGDPPYTIELIKTDDDGEEGDSGSSGSDSGWTPVNATVAQWGITMLVDSVTSTSVSHSATPNSVKTAYDKASLAYDKATAAYEAISSSGGGVGSGYTIETVYTTLPASGWSSSSQTVGVVGVSSTESEQLIFPMPALASQSAYIDAGILCTGQGVDSLTFSCDTTPTSDISIYVAIFNLTDSGENNENGDNGEDDEPSSVLAENTPDVIQEIAREGLAPNYWSVGDKIGIALNGAVGSLVLSDTYYAYIIGFNHNANVEGANSIHFQFGKTSSGTDIAFINSLDRTTDTTSTDKFKMNTTNTNEGGWASSTMRTDRCTEFLAVMPTDWQNVIKSCTKYSDNTGGGSDTASYVTATTDKIWLLSEFEVQGTRSYANSAEQNYQQQYAYYANGNSKVKYQHSATTTTYAWWLRSVVCDSSYYFCRVDASGGANFYYAADSRGFAPGFMVA